MKKKDPVLAYIRAMLSTFGDEQLSWLADLAHPNSPPTEATALLRRFESDARELRKAGLSESEIGQKLIELHSKKRNFTTSWLEHYAKVEMAKCAADLLFERRHCS